MNRFFKIGTKLSKQNQKTDISKRRARKDPLVEGMSLLVGMTSIPILGASPASVLSDLELFYIDFTLILHDFTLILHDFTLNLH